MFVSGHRQDIFSSPTHTYFVSFAHTDLYSVDTGVFPLGYSGRSVKFTIHINLALK